ncbi:MAG: cupin domain-containing protein [Phycisphaerales bacterium]
MAATTTSPVVRAADDGPVYQVVNHPTRCVMSASDTGGAYSLFELTCPPNDGVPMHTHTTEDETFIVLEGELTLTVGGVEHTIGPGGVAFGPRGIPHRFANRTDRTARFYVMTTPGGFERFFAAVDEAFGHGAPFDPRVFLGLIREHHMITE